MNPKWNPRELFGIDPRTNSPFTCVGVAKSKPRHPRCRNPIGRDKRTQASRLLDSMSKLAISGDDYDEGEVKTKMQELHREVLCWCHKEGATHPQCKDVEEQWWERLRNAQAQRIEQVLPLRHRPEAPAAFDPRQSRSLFGSVVPMQALNIAAIAQPGRQSRNVDPNLEEIADRFRSLEREVAEIQEAQRDLQLRLAGVARRRQFARRERAAITGELEEVGRDEEAATGADENRRAQEAARLVEAERQRHEADRRAEDERKAQAEQRRRYEEITRQQRERAERELAEQIRTDQALAQEMEDEEQRQEAERQAAARQEAQREERRERRIRDRVERVRMWMLAPGLQPPRSPPRSQAQYNPEVPASPFHAPIRRPAELHIVRRKPLDDCFACMEPIRALEDAQWCRAQCGQNMCNECFELWRANQPDGGQLRCGICRAVWKWAGLFG
ncbi:hypothetical protein MFRU_001g02590 [Monilinia fructicola]|nr:hypothetical protein MFRU_001g02590 [Monilinia fructicola]